MSDKGKNLKKRQSISSLQLDSSLDDVYSLGVEIGNILKAAPKSIEQNTVVILVEA